jgi:23S rRNA (guanosine2251-2'-O)-methyltransferase
VVGSEGFGISRLVKEQADFNIAIKMTGKVNSLNVSVATAILVSHISLNQLN